MRDACPFERVDQILEIQLQAELDVARIVSGDHLAEAGRRCVDDQAALGEVGVVKGVEEFATELHADALAEFEVSDAGHVPVLKVRSEKNAAPGGPEMANSVSKGCSVEPLGNCFGTVYGLARD